MRTLFILWAIPVVIFWGWYALSANDMHFGSIYFSRLFHDHMFNIYGQMLNMPPEEVPGKIAWVFFIDSILLFGIIAPIRWRKLWWPQFSARVRGLFGRKPANPDTPSSDVNFAREAGPAQPAE